MKKKFQSIIISITLIFDRVSKAWDNLIKKLIINKDAFINYKSKGLGDTIEKITTVTGIKNVVENVAAAVGKDCGCKKRKDALNRMFPYQNKK